jgi:alcohol dehydrogenase
LTPFANQSDVRHDHATHFFADYHLLPQVAILDPVLTVGLPPFLTAATGMDALSRGVEALPSAQRTPISDALGLHAIRLIRRWLPEAVKNGGDLSARGEMLLAAIMAGMAFSNAQVGLTHAIAHVVGARYGIHHGILNAIAMPYVMRHNNDRVADRHTAIAEALGVDICGMSEQAAGLEAAEAILGLNQKMGLPTRLQDIAIPESDLEICAEMAMADGSIVYDPKPVTEPAEVLRVLRAAWQGIS